MLYGTVYGDVAGSAYEFHPVKDDNFSTISKKHARFTDDTVMTAAVAHWLMYDPNRKPTYLVYAMQLFGLKYINAGYGRSFFNWLHDDKPHPYNSWGNGSAMRVSPCAWVAKSLAEAEKLAKLSAEVTHNHPEGIKGAQATAAAIYLAKTGCSKEDIKQYITSTYGYDLNRTTQEIKDSGYKFEVSCQKSVPEAIICFLESTDVENAIRLAISLKGDADTQAAIAGSIAEAFYGEVSKTKVSKYLDEHLNKTFTLFNKYCHEQFSNTTRE